MYDKEFYDTLNQFEQDAPKCCRHSVFLEKEPQEVWKLGHVFKHGETNASWRMFQLGASFGRCYYGM